MQRFITEDIIITDDELELHEVPSLPGKVFDSWKAVCRICTGFAFEMHQHELKRFD